MKKNCVLIATLPSLSNMDKVKRVFDNTYVSEVRFNTGSVNPYPPGQTIIILKNLADVYNKKLWIDIKGRQLRIVKWADPLFSCIELNHSVEVSYPAKIFFRNDISSNVTHVKDGNKIFVDPIPKKALGAGQSVNIVADNVKIVGYLTPTDEEYLHVCRGLEVSNIMASFVEAYDDFVHIRNILPWANIVSKIESLRGLEIASKAKNLNLMAARDDLYLQTGQGYEMIKHLKMIIEKDPNAICASRIFTSLEHSDKASLADFADLELMYSMGYRRFMLCDNVCNYAFDRAIMAWEEFVNG